MTEIEKMFENVGIEPVDCKLEPMRTLKFDTDIIGGTWTREQYMKEVPIYPPFTAEKQIELIKKLGNINIDIDNGCYMSSEILKVEAHCDEFEETLAEFVNNLWQSLTDQEKEEIRRILNE